MKRTVPNGRFKNPYDIDHPSSNFSEFQKNRLLEISKIKGFEHFCLAPLDNANVCIKHGPPCSCSPESPRRLGPFAVIWYSNGEAYVQRIGVNRVLTPVIHSIPTPFRPESVK